MNTSQFIYDITINEIKFNVSLGELTKFSTITNDSNTAYFHYHIQHECFLVLDKSSTFKSQKKTLTTSNRCVLIPPFTLHKTYLNDVFVFNFSISTTKPNQSTKKLLSFLNAEIQELKYNSNTLFYFQEFVNLLKLKFVTKKEVSSLLYLFFASLFKENGILFESTINPKYDYLRAIESYILNNFSNDISLEALANELFLSKRQLSRIIQKNFNQSFSVLVSNQRLEVASLLLKNTDEPIAKICDKVHINNESHFFKLFKEKYGCTPTEFRKGKTPPKKH